MVTLLQRETKEKTNSKNTVVMVTFIVSLKSVQRGKEYGNGNFYYRKKAEEDIEQGNEW